jgi:2-(1,2-epoxy-1,2-dihydrophenyl)acetyl-CoA isomerase
MSYETITYEVTAGVATITLNRPETLNAFNQPMIHETIKAFKAIHKDPAVRAVVLTASGRGFCSGQDLMEAVTIAGQANASFGDHLRHTYHILVKQMVTLEKPIIGAINGIAAGVGMSIALATDLRIISDKAAFALGFSKIGLVPDGGANWLLTRLVGYARAYEIAVSGEKVTAEQALAWGMVNKVVPHDQLAEVAQAYARNLAAGATLSFGLTKRAMLKSFQQTFDENLAYEAHLQDIAGRSADCQEGIMSFIEKRPPQFKGN